MSSHFYMTLGMVGPWSEDQSFQYVFLVFLLNLALEFRFALYVAVSIKCLSLSLLADIKIWMCVIHNCLDTLNQLIKAWHKGKQGVLVACNMTCPHGNLVKTMTEIFSKLQDEYDRYIHQGNVRGEFVLQLLATKILYKVGANIEKSSSLFDCSCWTTFLDMLREGRRVYTLTPPPPSSNHYPLTSPQVEKSTVFKFTSLLNHLDNRFAENNEKNGNLKKLSWKQAGLLFYLRYFDFCGGYNSGGHSVFIKLWPLICFYASKMLYFHVPYQDQSDSSIWGNCLTWTNQTLSCILAWDIRQKHAYYQLNMEE